MPLKGVDREFLRTQYEIEVSSREQTSLASRLMFIILGFGELFVDLSISNRLIGVLALSILLAVLWAIDDRRRTDRINQLEVMLVSRMSSVDDDDYIRSRYYAPFRMFEVIFRTEAILWLGVVVLIGLSQAKILH